RRRLLGNRAAAFEARRAARPERIANAVRLLRPGRTGQKGESQHGEHPLEERGRKGTESAHLAILKFYDLPQISTHTTALASSLFALPLLLSACGVREQRPPPRPAGSKPVTLNIPTSRETQACFADLARRDVRFIPL